MQQQYVPNLGEMPNEGSRRDCVHVAVAPVVAAMELKPGEHVGIDPDGGFGISTKPIGVVDPFLQEAVQRGERFWLFIYPGTITGLRHVWSHEAFKVIPPRVGGG